MLLLQSKPWEPFHSLSALGDVEKGQQTWSGSRELGLVRLTNQKGRFSAISYLPTKKYEGLK